MDVEVDGEHIELSLWDTCGLEEYERQRRLSYPDAHVILICFDISDPSTDLLSNIEEKVCPLIDPSFHPF